MMCAQEAAEHAAVDQAAAEQAVAEQAAAEQAAAEKAAERGGDSACSGGCDTCWTHVRQAQT